MQDLNKNQHVRACGAKTRFCVFLHFYTLLVSVSFIHTKFLQDFVMKSMNFRGISHKTYVLEGL